MRWCLAPVILLCGCTAIDDFFSWRIMDSDLSSTEMSRGAIRFVQAASNNTTNGNKVTSLSARFDSPPATGSLVVVAVSTFTAPPSSVTDGVGNTYLQIAAAAAATAGTSLALYYAVPVSFADPFTVNVTVPEAAQISLAIHEYSNVLALDQMSVASGSNSRPASGSATVTADGELFFAAMVHDHDAVTTADVDYTLRAHIAEQAVTKSESPLVTEDRIGMLGTATAAFALSTSDTWVCRLATFTRQEN